MATKTANVNVRIVPEIKEQAELILAQIGIPVSVLIDSLYRQIIMTGGIPYSITLPSIPSRDTMTEKQFNQMMEKGLAQASANQGLDIEDAFKKINGNV